MSICSIHIFCPNPSHPQTIRRDFIISNSKISRISQNSDHKVLYDAVCRRLLSEKVILAWILKHCLEEFRNYTIEEIAWKYIDNQLQISAVPVHPPIFQQESSPLIWGIAGEDVTPAEGRVAYDIRFKASVPISGRPAQFIINVEAQNDFYPGYPLIKRGIYYCGRMISSQYGREFVRSHYENIKKVYSIWICTNPPKKRRNSITRYCIAEENLVGTAQENPRNYNLMTAVIICLGQPFSRQIPDVLKLLNVLLAENIPPEEKYHILSSEFSIEITSQLKKEVSLMCNLSEGIERKGIRKGMKRGMRRGRRLGKIQGAISVYHDFHLPEQKILQNLEEKFHLTPEEARQYLNQYKVPTR